MRHGIIILLLLIAAPLFAQPVTKPAEKLRGFYDQSWAVFIGINHYKKWGPLQYAVSDAKAVQKKLVQMGFPESNIFMLTDTLATRNRILQVLGDELPRKLGVHDRVFIYFAGHGQTETLPDGQEGYLIPFDGDGTNLFSTCISMTTLRQISERMAAKHIFYAIDACYSGLALMRAGDIHPESQRYLEKVTQYRARQLITAGRAGEQVLERGGHGAFTRALLQALDGGADKLKPIGVLTGSELGSYLSSEVAFETGNKQTPQYGRLSSGEGEFLFVLPGYELALSGSSSQAPVPVAFGHVQVNVNVPNSRVYINGTYRGDAAPDKPLEWYQVGTEKVEVRVEAEGHESITKQVPLVPDQWTQEIFELPGLSNTAVQHGNQQEKMAAVGNFFMDTYEVTNGQFVSFLNEKGNLREGEQPWIHLDADADIERSDDHFRVMPGYETYPVTQVSWYGAKAYCEWAGKRLPTESEWQQACEGDGHQPYPWGQTFEPDHAKVKNQEDSHPGAAPVGSYPLGASENGVLDLAGNVWEWTASLSTGNQRVIRGGSWYLDDREARCQNRKTISPTAQGRDVGFRCVK